jgi:integrase
MRGSIQKQGKVYYAVIAINGKRKWFRGGTKKDAERVRIDKLKELNDGTYKEIPKTTFNEFADLWLKNHAEVNVKPATFRIYSDTVNKNFKPALDSLKLTDITTVDLQTYIGDRLKSVSPSSVGIEVTIMKLMFKHAYRWGFLKQNPADFVDKPKAAKPEIDLLTPDEVTTLLEHTKSHYRVAFLTDVMTGLRAGELWGLKWEDVDWNSKQIHVKRSLWKQQFQTPKSKYSIRRIDIPDMLVRELKKWKLASPVSKDDVIFPSPRGKRSEHINVHGEHFKPALRRAGLRHVSFHSLRHTNASMRIQAGQNIKYISVQLGHASIQITLDIYGHLFNDANFNRQQAELLETSFNSVSNSLVNAPENVIKDIEIGG